MEKIKKVFDILPGRSGEYAWKTFNIGVFGVKNNLVLAGILLIGYCVIAPAVYIAGTVDRHVSAESVQMLMGIYSVIAAYVGGLLNPTVMFAYVQKRRDREFYHAMPVKRGQYFIGYVLSGFVMYAVSYLLMCVVMAVITGFIVIAFSFVWQSLVLYLIIYATTTFAIMFSGSFLSSLVTLTFLNVFPALVVYCSLILRPVLDINAYFTLLTPYIFCLTPLTGGYILFDTYVIQGQFGWVLWVQLAIAVVELVLAYIMYKFRKGETTMAVAFPKTRYILQYGVMFLIAWFCTSVFSTITVAIDDLTPNFRLTVDSVIMTVIMTFVTFVVMNMILEQNFRAAFHKMRHLLIFGVAYVVVVAVIVNGVSGMPRWVIPIKTDAVLIYQSHYINTYDITEYEDGEYDWSTIYVDENKSLYQAYLGEEYSMVTDPEQVAELLKRISGFENNMGRYENYVDYYRTEGEIYFVRYSMYTLKPGMKIEPGMYTDELSDIYSHVYRGYLDYMPLSKLEEFTSGMDMIKMRERSYPYDYSGEYYYATTSVAEAVPE